MKRIRSKKSENAIIMTTILFVAIGIGAILATTMWLWLRPDPSRANADVWKVLFTFFVSSAPIIGSFVTVRNLFPSEQELALKIIKTDRGKADETKKTNKSHLAGRNAQNEGPEHQPHVLGRPSPPSTPSEDGHPYGGRRNMP